MNIDRTEEFFRGKQPDEQVRVKSTEILEFAEDHFDRVTSDSKECAAIGPWNGRQIRNAFQTAIALAQWEVEGKPKKKAVLRKKHFKQVADTSASFDQYLIRTYAGANDEDRALTEQERAPAARPRPVERLSSSASKSTRARQSTPSRGPKAVFAPAEIPSGDDDSEASQESGDNSTDEEN